MTVPVPVGPCTTAPDRSAADLPGPVRLVITADTHVTTDIDRVPPELWRAIADADVVVHAGDWVSSLLLDTLEARSSRLIGVYGNNDGLRLRARLPEVARVTVAGVRLVVVHETGVARGRERRCDRAYPEADVVVFGHSHIPWDTTTGGGLRLLNPGSPTDRRRQPRRTFLTATALDGRIDEVTLHQLPPRRPG